MHDQEKETPSGSPFSNNWMDAAAKFWETSLKLQTDAMENMSGMMNLFNTEANRSKADTAFKMGSSINKFVFSFLSNPANLTGFASASEVIPVLAMNMANNLTAGFAEIQSMLAEKSSKLGSDFKEIKMDEFNTGIYQIWKELYESDFQKFYHIPQLGLTRNYQEQINDAADKGNRFFIAFSEFMSLLSAPLEKAGASVMEAYQKMVDENQISDEPKEIYKLWIKTLEGYYMQLLQSSEYNRAMNELINCQAEYKKATGQIMSTCYKQLQIPTNQDLDELYRDIYLLKKKLRTVEKEQKAMAGQAAAGTSAAVSGKIDAGTGDSRPAKKATAAKTAKTARTAKTAKTARTTKSGKTTKARGGADKKKPDHIK